MQTTTDWNNGGSARDSLSCGVNAILFAGAQASSSSQKQSRSGLGFGGWHSGSFHHSGFLVPQLEPKSLRPINMASSSSAETEAGGAETRDNMSDGTKDKMGEHQLMSVHEPNTQSKHLPGYVEEQDHQELHQDHQLEQVQQVHQDHQQVQQLQLEQLQQSLPTSPGGGVGQGILPPIRPSSTLPSSEVRSQEPLRGGGGGLDLGARMDRLEANLEQMTGVMSQLLHELRDSRKHESAAAQMPAQAPKQQTTNQSSESQSTRATTSGENVLNFYGTYWIEP